MVVVSFFLSICQKQSPWPLYTFFSFLIPYTCSKNTPVLYVSHTLENDKMAAVLHFYNQKLLKP